MLTRIATGTKGAYMYDEVTAERALNEAGEAARAAVRHRYCRSAGAACT